MSNNISNNNRIARNTLFLYIRMFVVLIINLYTSRVILNTLGVSDYGVFNVVAGFVSLFAFLNATLSAATSRFYNYEGGKYGDDGYQRVYSVSIRVHIILACVVFILLESIGIWYINNVMVLPDGRLEAANYLFQFSVISMLLVIIGVPYGAAITSMERMDFSAIVAIIDVVLKLVIVLLLPFISFDRLIVYGFFNLCVTILNFAINFVYTKKQFSFIHATRHIDQSILKNMLSFSGWNLMGTIVFMLRGQGVNLLLNAFFGTVVNAARGVAFQINSAITGFSSNITASFKPQMVSSYAQGNLQRSLNLFTTQSKICFCLMLMLATPLIIEIDLVLHIWLGEAVPENTNIFASIVLVQTVIGVLNPPTTQLVYATGKVKLYQIVSSIVNIGVLPVCWLFLHFGFDAWIVFVVTLVFTIINQGTCIGVLCRVMDYKAVDYIKRVVMPCILMAILVPLVPVLIALVMDDSFVRILLVSLASLVMTCMLLYYLFLSRAEKEFVKQYLNRFLNRKKTA